MAWQKNLPNWLTYFRIAVIPAVVVTFYFYGDWGLILTSTLFLLASITDWLDGYVARALKATSNVGRFLDPIADKLLVATTLMLLVGAERAHMIPAIAIVCREILVSGLREFLAEIRVSVPVSHLAKWKTAVQMTAIYLLLLGAGAPHWLPAHAIGQGMLWLAAALTIFTGYAYMKTGWRHLSAE